MLKRFLNSSFKTQVLYILDLLLRRKNLDNGFIYEGEAKTKTRGDYELGALQKEILRPDAQWDSYRPKGELQRRNDQDKMACVTFSAMNCLETIVNFYIKENKEPDIVNVFKAFGLIKDGEANFSDRFIAKLSGTTIRGNSMQAVANAIRNYGLVAEDKWPYVNDWNEYYKPVPEDIKKLGKQFTEYIDIGYEWVNPAQFNDVKKFGTIQTAVCADWYWNSGGIIPRNEGQLNHAVDNDGFVYAQFDKIFDSYEPFAKTVSWNFNLGRGLIFVIKLKKKFSNQPLIDSLMQRGLEYVMDAEGSGAIWQLSSNGLHKVEPQELNDDYVRILANGKKLVGINKELMAKLIN